MENKLIAFLEDTSAAVDETTRFDFDRLLFYRGTGTLRPHSENQLEEIAAILKAYLRL